MTLFIIDEVNFLYLRKIYAELNPLSVDSYIMTLKPECYNASEGGITLWSYIEVTHPEKLVSEDHDASLCSDYSTYIPPEFHFEVLFMPSWFVPFMGEVIVHKVKTNTKKVMGKIYSQTCLYGFGRIYFDAARIYDYICWGPK